MRSKLDLFAELHQEIDDSCVEINSIFDMVHFVR